MFCSVGYYYDICMVIKNNRIMDATLFADGFDEAIIGLNTENRIPRVVYSKEKMIDIMAEQLADDSEDAVMDALEYLEYNTWCAYVGEGTPLYFEDRFEEDELEDEEIITYQPMSKEEIINFIDKED